jgi:protein AroM
MYLCGFPVEISIPVTSERVRPEKEGGAVAVLGLLTIGQSPRPDIVASMFGSVPVRCLEFGALDGLSREQIAALVPAPGEHPLVTRLRTGEQVTVAKEQLVTHLQRAADAAVEAGATLLVVLCTGTFGGLRVSVPLLYPDRLLVATVNALLPSGTLGVVMPHPGQYEVMERKWAFPGRRFVGLAASPYDASRRLADTGRQLAARGAALIVLDCMGFTQQMRRDVVEGSGRPVVLANRLVGRVLEELLDGSGAQDGAGSPQLLGALSYRS